MDKLISVIIPTFNRQEQTDHAIQSVNTSSPSLLEIVVVDDGGSIPYIFNETTNNYGVQVRIVRSPTNIGAGMARKIGVESASGQYIAFLDSDDSYDVGWMDYVVATIYSTSSITSARLFLSGKTQGGKWSGAKVRVLLAAATDDVRLVLARLAAIFFNPFYTPSIVLHRDLCEFRKGLRYCEDYYVVAVALFKADTVLLPDVTACHLGREPNSLGGQSGARSKMYSGEMEVRRAMIGLSAVGLSYKIFIPLGMLYQFIRSAVKKLISIIRVGT